MLAIRYILHFVTKFGVESRKKLLGIIARIRSFEGPGVRKGVLGWNWQVRLIVDRTLNDLTSLQKRICRSSIFNQRAGAFRHM